MIATISSTLSAETLRKAADLKERIEALTRELEIVLSSSEVSRSIPDNKPGEPKKRTMSPEARAKIAAAARKRWKKAKAEGKNSL